MKDYIAEFRKADSPEDMQDSLDWDSFKNLYLLTNVTQGRDSAQENNTKVFYITAKQDGSRLKMMYAP